MNHDQREGFSELLALAGEDLRFEEKTVRALIRSERQERAAFDLSAGDDAMVSIAFFASALERAPELGEHLADANGYAYRLTQRLSKPGALILRYLAQLS